jgi:Peptidase family C25
MKPIRMLRRTLWLVAVISVAVLFTACSGGGSPPPSGSAPVPPPTSLVKISTQTQGLVQVDFADLQTAGFTQNPLPISGLQLTNQGQPVALHVSSANGQTLGVGDSFQFYAQSLNTQYSGTNVYWLSAGGITPKTMTSRDGTVSGSPSHLGVFYDTIHLEKNSVIWGLTPGAPTADYWFWQALAAPTVQGFPFQLPGLSEANGASTLNLTLCGKTSSGTVSPDHHVIVSLNGTQVANLTWTGMTYEIQAIPLPRGILTPGANTLTLSLPGDTGAMVDTVLLNFFEIQYWRPLQALGGQLTFSIPANNPSPIQTGGFLGSAIYLLDVTDPLNAAFITPSTGEDVVGTFHILFQDPSSNTKTYLAITPDQLQTPTSMETWQPGLLENADNGADYILITPRAFLQAVQPLCDLRKSQGLRAKPVAVEDIYNEFGHGFPTPDSIKAFLSYASQNWVKPAPTYVLLLGDATYDYRNWQGLGKQSQVPCHLSLTALIGLTPDDNWYVALDGVDEIPSMQIGRIPSANPAQASLIVQKILQYEGATNAVPSTALFVADNNDATFQAACDSFAAQLPSKVAAQKIYLSQYTNFTQCTLDIVTAINAGAVLTTYNGHGDVADWAGEQVFNASYIPLLDNASQPTCMLILNCENAWFAMPGEYCLAESVVQAQDRGAIAVFGCSGLGYEWEHDLLGTQFMSLFFAGGNARIGDICTQAKVNAYKEGATADLLRTFTLIGDPATHIKLPK